MPQVWPVGALCRAVADALDLRFNPITVRGEVSGFTRASSGHCYFTLKDDAGQIRCALFRRAAALLDFVPTDGQLVQLRGRLAVYEARGELQVVVETMARAGQGALLEAFVRLKARLEAQGLFDPAVKRPLPVMPRAVGVVTSPQAAALHDVLTALARRAPHVGVVLAAAPVQGAQAAPALAAALGSLAPHVEVILLVRGGGSLEDLWAFNDEALAHAIRRCPVPVVTGIGHETDFTIADFCADLRAPTPTAAAELVVRPRLDELARLAQLHRRLQQVLRSRLDGLAQRLDGVAARLGRPSQRVAEQRLALLRCQARLREVTHAAVASARRRQDHLTQRWQTARQILPRTQRERLERLALRLELASPQRVLERGYALLSWDDGRPVTAVSGLRIAQSVRAVLADGAVDLTVRALRPGQFLQSLGLITHEPEK